MNRQQVIHATAKEKGFWSADVDIDFILAKIALIHSEVSEVLEAVRKEQGTTKILEEFADIVIRLEDLVEGMYEHGWLDSPDYTTAVLSKMLINETRPIKHGNLM